MLHKCLDDFQMKRMDTLKLRLRVEGKAKANMNYVDYPVYKNIYPFIMK